MKTSTNIRDYYYDNGEIKVYACSWILYVIFEKRSVTNE